MKTLPELMQEFMARDDWVVLDTETTGLKTIDGAELCEIAIVGPDRSVLLNTLIKPVCPIPIAATRIHGITNEMVESAPSFPQVYPVLVQALTDKTAVIYNASFDVMFILAEVRRNTLPTFVPKSWCMMDAYAEYHGEEGYYGPKRQKLVNACWQQGVEQSNQHRALDDALAVYDLMKKLSELVE